MCAVAWRGWRAAQVGAVGGAVRVSSQSAPASAASCERAMSSRMMTGTEVGGMTPASVTTIVMNLDGAADGNGSIARRDESRLDSGDSNATTHARARTQARAVACQDCTQPACGACIVTTWTRS